MAKKAGSTQLIKGWGAVQQIAHQEDGLLPFFLSPRHCLSVIISVECVLNAWEEQAEIRTAFLWNLVSRWKKEKIKLTWPYNVQSESSWLGMQLCHYQKMPNWLNALHAKCVNATKPENHVTVAIYLCVALAQNWFVMDVLMPHYTWMFLSRCFCLIFMNESSSALFPHVLVRKLYIIPAMCVKPLRGFFICKDSFFKHDRSFTTSSYNV